MDERTDGRQTNGTIGPQSVWHAAFEWFALPAALDHTTTRGEVRL